MAGSDPGVPYGAALRDLVREGKLGTVTYVTAADRRRVGAGGVDHGEDGAAAQLAAFAAVQLDDLARVFQGQPVRVMARLEPVRTEAWLELSNDIRLHYDGVLAAGPDAHELWIDGARGALRVAHGALWWRRRGWRWFVPIGLRDRRLETAPEGVRDARRAALRAAALDSARRMAVVRVADPPADAVDAPAERMLAR